MLNNRDLNQVTWEQRAFVGDPKFEASQDLPDFPYAGFAQSLSLHGIRVDTPDRIGAAWDEALAADRPVVLEAITDPERAAAAAAHYVGAGKGVCLVCLGRRRRGARVHHADGQGRGRDLLAAREMTSIRPDQEWDWS